MASNVTLEGQEIAELLRALVEEPEAEKKRLKKEKKRVIVLSGPTAVGKSALAMLIAKAIGGEIVSADSMQIYRGMDIGTAKATPQEREEIPHHLIDICELNQPFNVVAFYNAAMDAIDDIIKREAVPIVVGGTGFYIHTLVYGPPCGPPAAPELRDHFLKEAEEKGIDFIYQELVQKDPDYAATVTPHDKQKVARALEIMALTNRKVSEIPKHAPRHKESYDFRCWFLHKRREKLYPEIEARCDLMIQNGLLQEVKNLVDAGLEQNYTAKLAIGYRQALEYLASAKTDEDYVRFLDSFKKQTRRLAKRQFTWFRKEPLFRWLDVMHYSQDTLAEIILQDFEIRY